MLTYDHNEIYSYVCMYQGYSYFYLTKDKIYFTGLFPPTGILHHSQHYSKYFTIYNYTSRGKTDGKWKITDILQVRK